MPVQPGTPLVLTCVPAAFPDRAESLFPNWSPLRKPRTCSFHACQFRPSQSHQVRSAQFRGILVSRYIELYLSLPGTAVTWLATGSRTCVSKLNLSGEPVRLVRGTSPVGGIPVWSQRGNFRYRSLVRLHNRFARFTAVGTTRPSRLSTRAGQSAAARPLPPVPVAAGLADRRRSRRRRDTARGAGSRLRRVLRRGCQR